MTSTDSFELFACFDQLVLSACSYSEISIILFIFIPLVLKLPAEISLANLLDFRPIMTSLRVMVGHFMTLRDRKE